MMDLTIKLVNGERIDCSVDDRHFDMNARTVYIKDKNSIFMIPITSIVYVHENLQSEREAENEEAHYDGSSEKREDNQS